MTCYESFTRIRADIHDPANFEESSRARCAEMGFDPTIPAEYNQCKTMIGQKVDRKKPFSKGRDQLIRIQNRRERQGCLLPLN